MVTINQDNATINNQYIADTMNFNDINSVNAFLQALKQFQSLLGKSIEDKVLAGDIAKRADESVKEIITQVESPTPDKKKISDYLSSVTTLVSKVDGLAGAANTLLKTVGDIF